MTPRRITVLGPLWPYRGGIAHFSASLARDLSTRGHTVRTLTFRRQYPSRLFPGTTQYESGPPPEGVPLAARVLDTLNPLSWRRTARRVISGGTDVLVLMYWMSFFAPALTVVARYARRRGVRVVTVVHNALPHEPRPGDAWLAHRLFRSSDGLVVMSDQVRRDVERIGGAAAVQQVAHPVYDTFGDAIPREAARAALSLDADAPTLLFFGFVRPYKGLDVLLDAMPAVLARVPEARLVVAGEFYADESELRQRAEFLGNAVRFDASYIPDAAVGRYFGAADVVVQPYRTATQSGVAQIAFHFGRPVITTDVGGLAEVVPDGDAGLVVPPEDPARLADAIARFFEEDLGPRLTRGVERERARYSWARLSEAVEALGAS